MLKWSPPDAVIILGNSNVPLEGTRKRISTDLGRDPVQEYRPAELVFAEETRVSGARDAS
jgi:hypothetical protein